MLTERGILSGYEGVEVGLKIGGVDKGYVKDYYVKHGYETTWEIYGLRFNGTNIPYTASGKSDKDGIEILLELNTITFTAHSAACGTVSTSILTVLKNTTYTTSGNILTLSDGRKVTANIREIENLNASFDGWSSTSGTITSPTIITAMFSQK